MCNLLVDKDIESIPISNNSLLLRGTKLKNTSWVVGLVVYTGKECKITLN